MDELFRKRGERVRRGDVTDRAGGGLVCMRTNELYRLLYYTFLGLV